MTPGALHRLEDRTALFDIGGHGLLREDADYNAACQLPKLSFHGAFTSSFECGDDVEVVQRVDACHYDRFDALLL